MNAAAGAQDIRLRKDAATTTAQNAALRGATMAFGKPPVKPKPQINTYSGTNGALAAATKAGASRTVSNKASLSSIRSPTNEHLSGYLAVDGSSSSRPSTRQTEHRTTQQRLNQYEPERNGKGRPTIEQAKSESYIAANFAASRSASVSPNVTGQQQYQPMNLGRASNLRGRATSPVKSIRSLAESSDHSGGPDMAPIAPTTSLIDMFENSGGVPKGRIKPKKSSSSSPRKSRSLSPKRSQRSSKAPPSILPTKPVRPEIKSPKPSLAQLPKQMETVRHAEESPKPSKPPVTATKPIPIPSRSRQTPLLKPRPQPEEDDDSSDDSFVSASDYKPSFRAELNNQQRRRLTSASAVSVNSAATIDSMANAIVASSLASSRAASPSRSSVQGSLLAPPPPPTRRSPHRGHIFHVQKDSRTPSPQKHSGLRSTLRKPKSKEEIDEGEKRRTKKAHLMKKHPNKHHEGDRKRWRDQITERERKRYEAVWASNKGLHMPSLPDAENMVCSLVVRDIWSRSRLHPDVLEEVWTLVERNHHGYLDKEGFVVGLWLIDQRLKGRKLPIRVSESVWHSVGILGGIKVKKAKH
ncbi:hypothetical protein B0J14DRAFT_578625 [Halenospora varia]|nr:hypothetical protein B0J14DRAFT_578625 [Halenospora varia]